MNARGSPLSYFTKENFNTIADFEDTLNSYQNLLILNPTFRNGVANEIIKKLNKYHFPLERQREFLNAAIRSRTFDHRYFTLAKGFANSLYSFMAGDEVPAIRTDSQELLIAAKEKVEKLMAGEEMERNSRVVNRL